jgi:hypothetical protein
MPGTGKMGSLGGHSRREALEETSHYLVRLVELQPSVNHNAEGNTFSHKAIYVSMSYLNFIIFLLMIELHR